MYFRAGSSGSTTSGSSTGRGHSATGNFIEQSDGTSWMAMYCLHMLAMAIELAHDDPAYEDVASKFFEHFVYISQAMNDMGGEGIGLWSEADGFYYDMLHLSDGRHIRMKARSMVGLVPLFAVETFEPEDLAQLAFILAPDALVPRPSSGRRRTRRHEPAHRAGACACCSRSPTERSSSGSTDTSSMKTSFFLRTASARFRNSTRIIPTCSVSTGSLPPSITSRANPPAIFSAGIRTGAGPCGFR